MKKYKNIRLLNLQFMQTIMNEQSITYEYKINVDLIDDLLSLFEDFTNAIMDEEDQYTYDEIDGDLRNILIDFVDNIRSANVEKYAQIREAHLNDIVNLFQPYHPNNKQLAQILRRSLNIIIHYTIFIH